MRLGERILHHVRAARLRWVVLCALTLFFAADLWVRHVETIPGLVLRNEGRSHDALPYFFRQIALTKDEPAVVFLGASVTQGVMNTTAEATAPVRAEAMLRERGVRARCFNLATIGNNLGDHLGIAAEAIRNGADLIVMPLHFKLFSDQGTLATMTCHKDTASYLRLRPDFREFRRKRLHLSDREYQELMLGSFVERHWALYRERGLIPFLLTGKPESLAAQFQAWVFEMADVHAPEGKSPVSVLATPEERNADNIWAKQSNAYHDNNRECYDKVPLDPDEEHYRMLREISELTRRKGVKTIFFLQPLNRTAVDRFGYFDWARHARFAEITREVAQAGGHSFLDLTDAVDNRFFTDGDHLNMNGHKQLAAALTGPVADLLAGRP